MVRAPFSGVLLVLRVLFCCCTAASLMCFYGVVLVSQFPVLRVFSIPCIIYLFCLVSFALFLRPFCGGSCFPVVVFRVAYLVIAGPHSPLSPYGMHCCILSAMAVRARTVGAGVHLRYKRDIGGDGALLLGHERVALPNLSGLVAPSHFPAWRT